MGKNNKGQLGICFTSDSHAQPHCLNLPTRITQVSCGASHTLMLSSDNRVFACGSNEEGQLGIGNCH